MQDIEKALEKIRKDQKDIGVATESLNRLPIFQPTLKPRFETRTFESKYGIITVRGRLGQNHKSLLETILYKRKAYRLHIDKDEDDIKVSLEVLYNEYEVKKYLSLSSRYSDERYKQMVEDMITAYIELKKDGERIAGTLVARERVSEKYYRKTKSNLPQVKGKEIPYTKLEFGDVASKLIVKELKFTYDPKPIMRLDSGVSQAIVRYLKTQRNHPSSGYHLKALLEELIENVEGHVWKNIRRFLKKDTEQLEKLGIVIDFKKDRLFVINNQIML
jgi:hypothetical protein